MTPLNYFNQQYGWQNQNNYNLTATATPQGAWANGVGDNINTVAKSTPEANLALASDPNSGSFAFAYDGIMGKMAQSFAGPTNQNPNAFYGNNSGLQFPLANTVPIQTNYAQGQDQQYPQLQQNFAPVVGNNNNSFQPQQMMQIFQQMMQFMNYMMQMLQQMMGGGNNPAFANQNGYNTGTTNTGSYYPNNSNTYGTGSNNYGNSYPSNSGSSGTGGNSSSASAYYSPQGSGSSANSSSPSGISSATATSSSSASASASSNDTSSYSSNGGTCNPVDGGRISSGFGMRVHPITGKRKFHKGIDIAAPKGTPIKSTQDGYVEFAGVVNGYGNRVVINHGNGVKTTYNHCNSINVKAGQNVGSGQKIATVGSTGNSTGPHLHYEKIVNGKYVDPRA